MVPLSQIHHVRAHVWLDHVAHYPLQARVAVVKEDQADAAVGQGRPEASDKGPRLPFVHDIVPGAVSHVGSAPCHVEGRGTVQLAEAIFAAAESEAKDLRLGEGAPQHGQAKEGRPLAEIVGLEGPPHEGRKRDYVQAVGGVCAPDVEDLMGAVVAAAVAAGLQQGTANREGPPAPRDAAPAAPSHAQ